MAVSIANGNRTGNKPESSRPNKHAESAAQEFLEVSNCTTS